MAPKPEEINVTPPNAKSVSGSAGGNAFVNNAFENDKSVNQNSSVANMQLAQVAGKDAEEKPSLDFDDLLPYIGEFGLYQKMLFLCMIPFAFFVAFVYFSQIFMTLVPEEHWCRVPELDHLNLTERLALAIPGDDVTGYSKCSMYNVNFTEVLAAGALKADPSWPTIPCKYGWEYNFTEIPYSTIATDLDWVCDNAALPSLSQSIFFVGAIVGGLLFGWIADRWGRIPALVWCNVIGFGAGIATAFSTSFWLFALCRFIVGFAFDNCFTMMYILLLEYVGPKWRTFVANMSIAIFFTTAASILPWIAYYLADWKLFTIVTSAPLALAVLTPWVVPESARWLVSQGKIEKAIGILKRFEKVNGKSIEPQIYKDFSASCVRLQEEEDANNNYSIIDLFKTPRLRRITILLIVIWMAISLVFDGHVRNVGSLGLDLFITFTIASATEFPADTVLTLLLDRWGRRWMTCGSMVISGVFSLLATTVPVGIASATLAIFGRFSVNISYSIGLQYAAELLPTVVRAQGVAFIHIMGYVASIVAPFVVYLANIDPSFPLIILGILGIFGGLLSLYLPETLDKDLPQTLADGEEFGRGQKVWEFPCIGKKPVQEEEEKEKPVNQTIQHFKRGTSRGASLRASTRGELRSSILQRSARSRFSGRYIPRTAEA